MTSLSVRVALVVVCLAAGSAAGFLIWTSEQQTRGHASAVQHFSSTAYSARTAVSDLRGAQQAYVASGQGTDFWYARVAAISKELHDELGTLKSLASAPDASIALDEAAGALQDFDQMDRRARDFARGRQLTAASDLIFGDGFDLTKKAGDAVDRAVNAELADRNGVLSFLKRREAYALAGGSAVFAIVLALLVPVAREPRGELLPQPSIAPRAQGSRSQLSSEDLDDLRLIAAPAPAKPAPKRVNLDGVAQLCTDLAKVADTRALPAILERASGLLDAAGLVVWIADPDGRELAPILVHGYPPTLATRLGTIPRDATNVTASAYRTGLLQTMKGDSVSNGAIAAPLVSATGCVGVLAVEMKDGGEKHDQLLSAAAIVASQLATLVGPPSARAGRTEAAG